MKPFAVHLDHARTAYTLVTVIGRLDAESAPVLWSAVEPLLAAPFVAIDLRHAVVAGRVGLAPLIGVCKACRDRGGEFYLVAAPPMVTRVLSHDTRGPVLAARSRDALDDAIRAERALAQLAATPAPLAPCGTAAAYKRHRAHGEQACDACKAAAAEAQKQYPSYTSKHVPRGELQPCGTRAAYSRHLAHGEPACDACKAANNARSKSLRVGAS